MGTIVSFHAHPDDESIATSGLLARAADAGHRVVLVFATRGELGTPVDGVLDEDEQLALRRTAECYESASVIGAHRVEFLGFTDSGMEGDATNDAPWCFWQADVDHAARRLAIILEEEQADVITVYDDHGGYGHPDHIQVHRVGHLAGAAAGVPRVLEATMDRDAIFERMTEAMERGELPDDFEVPEATEDQPFGSPSEVITHEIDVTPFLSHKRDALAAHASQVGPDSFFLSMPDHAFAQGFGLECFIDPSEPRPPGAPRRTDLFEGL